MPTTIKLKNSVTTTNAPSSLVQGEVAINITDKKVWVGNAATTPVQLLGDGGSASFTSIAFGAGTVSNPSITFTGDTNTGIYSPAADTIAFTEGGVESMRIDSSGNVGIGTSNPAERLQLSTSGNTYLRISGGASNSQAGVQLYANSVYRSALYYDDNAGTTYLSTAVGTQQILSITGTPLIFNTGNNVERMRITSAGDVFIAGTSAPVLGYEKLGIVGAGSFRSTGGTVLGLWNTTNAGLIQFYTEGGGTGAGSIQATGAALSILGGSSLGLTATGANPITFGTNSAERMRIDSSGRITTPAQPAFFAYNTTGYSGTGTVPWNATTLNRGNNFNTSTYTFTAPVSGLYWFNIIITNGNTLQNLSLIPIYVNGGRARDMLENNPMQIANSELHASTILYLNANDAVTVNNGGSFFEGGALGYGFYSAFQGYLIG